MSTNDRTTATSHPALTTPGTLVTRAFSEVRLGLPADQLPRAAGGIRLGNDNPSSRPRQRPLVDGDPAEFEAHRAWVEFVQVQGQWNVDQLTVYGRSRFLGKRASGVGPDSRQWLFRQPAVAAAWRGPGSIEPWLPVIAAVAVGIAGELVEHRGVDSSESLWLSSKPLVTPAAAGRVRPPPRR